MDLKTPTDRLHAHARMLANTDGSLVFWLHFAQIYAEVPGSPVMLLARAQTCAVLRATLKGNNLRVAYREAGIYLAPDSDRLLTEFRNPMTGKSIKMDANFREGPAVYTRTATAETIMGNSELDVKTQRPVRWSWHSSGSKIWMVNDDPGTFAPGDPKSEKVQARDPLSGRILQTWHADQRDLDKPGLTSVPCFKNYVVATSAWMPFFGDPGVRGSSFIRGMGAKLNEREVLKTPEFRKLNETHADFFAEARTAS